MKKLVPILAILLVLSLAACSNQDTSPSNMGNTQSENITMLDEGVWPANEYTEGLPVPPGTVDWVMLDTQSGYCGIFIEEISEAEYNDYIDLLKQEGYSVVKEASEEIKGQNYVSIGTILSNGEKGLSISYVPGNFGIYISFND